MVACRPRADAPEGFRISTAFNVSQHDRAPLDLFRGALACGTMRRAGNGGWCWEVKRLSDQGERIAPFFERFSARRDEGDRLRVLEQCCATALELERVRPGPASRLLLSGNG